MWETEGEYSSQWAAICSIAEKVGCTAETLRKWVRQAGDDGASLVHHSDRGGQYLGRLGLYANQLTGPIPAGLGNLSNLLWLGLWSNQLTGLVPIQVPQLGAAAPTCDFRSNASLYMPATPDYQALGDPICGIALTPLEDVANEVTEQISDLVTSGELRPGLGNALIKQIDKALEKLNRGKTAPATNMLNDLIAQITDLIADGQISAAEGGNLIALATALLP